MNIKICEECGKEFSTIREEQRFCCRSCASTYMHKIKKIERCSKCDLYPCSLPRHKCKLKQKKKHVEYIKKYCEYCGKEFKVIKSRDKTAKFCSVECAHKSKIKLGEYTCAVCGKKFLRKTHHMNDTENHCCSKHCYLMFQRNKMTGKNNPQYGLKGALNNSFKNVVLHSLNGNNLDFFVYKKDHPYARSGRVVIHRALIEDNHELFNNVFFDIINDKFYLKKNIQVHHIDCDHNNNSLQNLIPLTLKQHTRLHNILLVEAFNTLTKINGVLKCGELLETQEVDNQQPSLDSNIFEGSETNGRDLIDQKQVSNTNTSAVLTQIKQLNDDYIVQTSNITKQCYLESIKEMEECQIKS